jgi:hypothetical protein
MTHNATGGNMLEAMGYRDLDGHITRYEFNNLDEAIKFVERDIEIKFFDRAMITNDKGDVLYETGSNLTEEELFNLP